MSFRVTQDSAKISQQAVIKTVESKAESNLGKIGTRDVKLNGQIGTIHKDSESLIEQAEEKADIILQEQKERKGSDDYSYEDDEAYAKKEQVFENHLNRLDPTMGKEPYKNFAKTVQKHQIKAQEEYIRENSSKSVNGKQEEFLYRGETLTNNILKLVGEDFGSEVEKDNALQCLLQLQQIEQKSIDDKKTKIQENIVKLSTSSLEAAKPHLNNERDKLRELERNTSLMPQWTKAIKQAKQQLNDRSSQEIKDGYNLIQKAYQLHPEIQMINGKEVSPTDRGLDYLSIIEAGTMLEVIEIWSLSCRGGNCEECIYSTIEVVACDIKSANPSRSVPHLIALRETLFKAPMGLQLYRQSSKLKDTVDRLFPNLTNQVKQQVAS